MATIIFKIAYSIFDKLKVSKLCPKSSKINPVQTKRPSLICGRPCIIFLLAYCRRLKFIVVNLELLNYKVKNCYFYLQTPSEADALSIELRARKSGGISFILSKIKPRAKSPHPTRRVLRQASCIYEENRAKWLAVPQSPTNTDSTDIS